jgi:hypothetical protein
LGRIARHQKSCAYPKSCSCFDSSLCV